MTLWQDVEVSTLAEASACGMGQQAGAVAFVWSSVHSNADRETNIETNG